jgi:hypothetical protein
VVGGTMNHRQRELAAVFVCIGFEMLIGLTGAICYARGVLDQAWWVLAPACVVTSWRALDALTYMWSVLGDPPPIPRLIDDEPRAIENATNVIRLRRLEP